MNTTQLRTIIKFWENRGHFNLDLYHKYLLASSENTPEKFNENKTEGDFINTTTVYLLIFSLAAMALLAIKYLF